MNVNATIEEIRQNSTTTKPNKYRLSLEAVGTIKNCDELMEWIKQFGEKKQMKDYKAWHR